MKALIADAGATKTDWVKISLSRDGEISEETYSGAGISPNLHSSDAIEEELRMVRSSLGDSFSCIQFYGAGVGSPSNREKMVAVLSETFDCHEINVQSDMEGAAKAVLGDRPGIACIMGTGSNSCHFDGLSVDRIPSSLGYLLDDKGGGFAFGSRLLSDIYKGIAPDHIIRRFEETYSLTVKDVVYHLYHQPAPNAWIAGFMPFITDNIDDPYVGEMVRSQIRCFFDREFHIYPETQLREEGIGFVGSVASVLSAFISAEMEARGWRLTAITPRPLDRLKEQVLENMKISMTDNNEI